jgi:hypothetical protein
MKLSRAYLAVSVSVTSESPLFNRVGEFGHQDLFFNPIRFTSFAYTHHAAAVWVSPPSAFLSLTFVFWSLVLILILVVVSLGAKNPRPLGTEIPQTGIPVYGAAPYARMALRYLFCGPRPAVTGSP